MNRADTVHDKRALYGRCLTALRPARGRQSAGCCPSAQAYPSGKADTLRRKSLSHRRFPPSGAVLPHLFRASIILCSVALIIAARSPMSTAFGKKKKLWQFCSVQHGRTGCFSAELLREMDHIGNRSRLKTRECQSWRVGDAALGVPRRTKERQWKAPANSGNSRFRRSFSA